MSLGFLQNTVNVTGKKPETKKKERDTPTEELFDKISCIVVASR